MNPGLAQPTLAQQNLTTALHQAASKQETQLGRTQARLLSEQLADVDVLRAQREAEEATLGAAAVRRENERYKELLARPLIDILQENADLRKAYERQQEVLREWMISQEAFKQVASKFREKLSITPEDANLLFNEEVLKATAKIK